MARDGYVNVPILNGWKGRPYQKAFWDYMVGGGRFATKIWPRRAGKDEVDMRWTALAAHRRIGSYWHMIPEAAQARRAIWDAVDEFTGVRRIKQIFHEGIVADYLESQMMIRFKCGSTWQLLGSDNFNSLVGSPPIGLVFSEWALAKPEAWAYLSPILANNGGWAIFNTTPRGINHAHATYEEFTTDPEAFAELLTVDDTRHVDKEYLDKDLKQKIGIFGKAQGFALWRQEFYCTWDEISDESFIPSALSLEAIMREDDPALRVGHERVMGVDPARFGVDRSVITKREGYVCHPQIVYEQVDTMELANRIYMEAQSFQPHQIAIDSGYNPGVIDACRALGLRNIIEVNFGTPNVSPYAVNWRADMYRKAKLWLEAGGVLPNGDKELASELSRVKARLDNNKVKLQSKDEIKREGKRSPDKADSFVTTFAHDVDVNEVMETAVPGFTPPSNDYTATWDDEDPFADVRGQ